MMSRAPILFALAIATTLAGCVTPPDTYVTGRAENAALRFSAGPYVLPAQPLTK